MITLKGIEEIKTEKKATKQSEEYFFHQRCKKQQQTLNWLLDFDWLFTLYGYLILTFHWFISAG